jgi:4-amino-4-deoxy-L-arabinose transferase-like glycosyltransferase
MAAPTASPGPDGRSGPTASPGPGDGSGPATGGEAAGGRSGPTIGGEAAGRARIWWLALGAIVILAAILRLGSLPTRATWDADQGHDMLTLMAFVRDGVFPLVGPPTSIGDFHHGAAYYYLLAPAAWLGGGDPAVVVGEIAVLGILAVALVATLARSVGGTVAGIAAGLLMAVSATAIDESTFLWNPNLVAFTSALAVCAAWRAWTTRRVRWWLLVAAAQAATMQCHVLGFVLLPPLVAWLIADARRRPATERRAVAGALLGGIAVIALSYVPLLASELQTGFHESKDAIAFLVGGGQAAAAGPLVRLVFVTLRILAWPLSGLLLDSLAVGVPVAILVATFAVWRGRVADRPERDMARWLVTTLLWSCLLLGITISGLATVTPLPVDHYHAFLDPLVFLAIGLGVAGLARLSGPMAARAGESSPGRRLVGRPITVGGVAAVAVMFVLVGWNVLRLPPSVAVDGGYPAAESAGRRIVSDLGGRTGLLASLPDFKTPEAYAYPVSRLGGQLFPAVSTTFGLDAYVVVCDSLFVPDCGGPAEDRAAASLARPLRLVDRFAAAPGRMISVYIGSAPVVFARGR